MSRSVVAADIYEQHIREVQLAESLRYSSYFIIEHQNSHVGQITAPSVYLCAVAQHTSRIRIGTMIYQLPLHNPLRLAQDAAMLDHLSRGRLEFGAGLGTHEHEFMRWNTSFAERRAMGDEALEIILKAWTEETVSKKLEEYQRRIGYDVFCANHRIGTMPLEQVVKSLKLFGEEVIPAFA